MINENELRLIEQYLHQELDLKQLKQVERRIAEDPEFALQFEIIRDLPKAVQLETEHFRHDLRSIMQQPLNSSKSKSVAGEVNSSRRVMLLRLIISVAAVIAGITLAIQLLMPVKDVDLYAAYFDIPQENITVRNESLDLHLDEAIRSYSEKNYALAVESFQRFLNENPTETPALFFYAMSLMAIEKYDEAQPVLTEIQNQESVYRNAAKWYLGLLYLKKQDLEKAKTLFGQLKNSANNYSERASEIWLHIIE